MKLEEQVCSLELAKKLMELGIKQDSFWYWIDKKTDLLDNPDAARWGLIGLPEYEQINGFSAFTVAELGEMLPITVTDPPIPEDANPWEYDKITMWVTNRVGNKYNKPVSEVGRPNHKKHKAFEEETEANARAKMLIYLLENKIIEKG